MKSELLVASLRALLDQVELLEAVTESFEAIERHTALNASGGYAEGSEEEAVVRWRRGDGLHHVATRKTHAFVVAELRRQIEQLRRRTPKAGGAARRHVMRAHPIEVEAGPDAEKRGL
jgi:hypothetical protein